MGDILDEDDDKVLIKKLLKENRMLILFVLVLEISILVMYLMKII